MGEVAEAMAEAREERRREGEQRAPKRDGSCTTN